MLYEDGIRDLDMETLVELWQMPGMAGEITAETERILQGACGRKVKEHKELTGTYFETLCEAEKKGKEPLSFFWFELTRTMEEHWTVTDIKPHLPLYFPLYSLLPRDTIEELAGHPVDPRKVYRGDGRGVMKLKMEIRFVRITTFHIVGVIHLLEDGWFTRNAKKHDGRGENIIETDQAFRTYFYYAQRHTEKSAAFMKDFIRQWLSAREDQEDQSNKQGEDS